MKPRDNGPTNPEKSGRTGAKGGGVFSATGAYPEVMGDRLWPSVLVATVVCVALGVGLVAAGTGALALPAMDGDGGVSGASADTDANATAELEAGSQLSGLVGVQNRAVRGTVDRESFRARLDGADTPRERAAVLGRQVSALDTRVGDLEDALRSLERERDDGTLDGDAFVARSAEIGGAAAGIDDLLDESRTAAEALPSEVREERDLLARIDSLDDRVGTLRERTNAATRAIDGVDQPRRASPVSIADVETMLTGALAAHDAAERLFGSERIDLHVRRANGATMRIGVVTDGGEVVAIERGTIDDPTVRVYTDYAVVRTIQYSDQPETDVQQAFDEDRIVYDGVGVRNSIRYGAAAIAETLRGLF